MILTNDGKITYANMHNLASMSLTMNIGTCHRFVQLMYCTNDYQELSKENNRSYIQATV